MKVENLKKGSIVMMIFSTYESNAKPEWTILRKYLCNNIPFVEYSAHCTVVNVTPKFFSVIIPHLGLESVRYSKECFTTTKHSYADSNSSRRKPEIIKL